MTTEPIRFTRNDTNIVKGLAIMAMVFHHVCPNNTALSVIYWKTIDLQTILASSGKVCVALLTILSGYGLTESYKRFTDHSVLGGIRFSVSQYVQLLSMYWCFYICAYAIQSLLGMTFGACYGSGGQGVFDFILDILGVGMLGSGKVLIGGWYLSAIVAFYFLFPLLYVIVKKIRWGALVVAYLPWGWYLYVRDLNMHTDWFLFYIVSFVIGIYLSLKEALDRMLRLRGVGWSLGAVVVFVAAVVLRLLVTLPFDPILALACIVLAIFVLRKIQILHSLMVWLGTLSAGIWLLHMLVGGLIASLSFETYWGRFILLLFLTAGGVMIIVESKRYVGYEAAVRKIRDFIEIFGKRISKGDNHD